jgi:hypothetical protein
MRKLLIAALAALCAGVLAPAALAGGPAMLVGATEDAAQQPSLALAKTQMDMARLAGFDAVRLAVTWDRGETALTDDAANRLGNAVSAANLDGIHPIVSIYPRGSTQTPLTDAARADFAAFAVSVLKAAPTLSEVIVGNEPNLNRFWLPQFDDGGGDAVAPAFLQLLATTYDALKAVNPELIVAGIGLSPRGGDNPTAPRKTHSPTAFLTDIGVAYRASGRTTPIMDELAFHPYEDNSSVEPTAGQHPSNTTIALADYGKLVSLLGTAFDGTAQLGSKLPILYDEFGVETQIPAAKAPLYTGTEVPATKPVDEATQARYYREAVALAFCQPTVHGILLFHVRDEAAMPAWQSGVFYVNGKPKTSLGAVRAASLSSHRGDIAACSGLSLTPDVSVKRFVTATANPPQALVHCDVTCDFRLRLEKLPAASPTVVVPGQALGGIYDKIALPGRVRAGRYRFTLIAWAHVNRGKTVRASSGAFTLQ